MKILSLDVEGKYGVMNPSEEGFYTSCVGLLTDKGDYRTVWLEHAKKPRDLDAAPIIQQALEEADILVGHNLKYDLKCIMHYGVQLPPDLKIFDTCIAEYILTGHDVRNLKYGLDVVAKRHGIVGKLGNDEVNAFWDAGVETRDIPAATLEKYLKQDCVVPLQLYDIQRKIIKEQGLERVVSLQNKWALCLTEMEWNGVGFNKEMAEEMVAEHTKLAEDIQDFFRREVGLPHLALSSGKQRSALLFGGELTTEHREWVITTLKTKPESTYKEKTIRETHTIPGLGFGKPVKKHLNKHGYYKTNKYIIRDLSGRSKKLKHYKKLLLDFSKYTKIQTTLKSSKKQTGLLYKIGKDGCIHPSFNQVASTTGRLTSRNPNGQNLFSAIKVCFCPTLDFLGQLDLSQMEWRSGAELAKDRTMIDEVNRGVDQHAATTVDMMELPYLGKHDKQSRQNRTFAKIFNFRMIFGGSKWGFYLDLDMPDFSLKKWQETIDSFWKKYWELANFHDRNIQRVIENGWYKSITGRWHKFNKCKEVEGEMTYSPNQIRNYMIQGFAGGDALPLAAVIIRKGMQQRGMKSKMVLTVHDSLVFDIVAEEADSLKQLCLSVANNLHTYVSNYYQIPWETKLAGEFEVGYNYRDLTEVTMGEKIGKVMNKIQ